MNTFKKIAFCCLMFATLLSACKKGGGSTPNPTPTPSDTTKPTISIAKPSAGQTVTNGSTIPFEVTFTDDVSLKSYSVSIALKQASGINLNSGASLKITPVSTPYSYTKASTSLNAGAKSQTVTLTDMAIPANTISAITTPGTYNLTVNCLDTSDNAASTTLVFSIN